MVHDDESLATEVIGAAIEVHRHLGPGFLEAIYEEALCRELAARQIPFARQVLVDIEYKGSPIGNARLDMLVADQLVVEPRQPKASRPCTWRRSCPT